MTMRLPWLALVGLFIGTSLLFFGRAITQVPTSSNVGQQPPVLPAILAFNKTAAAYDPINKPASFDDMYDAVMEEYHMHKVDPTAAGLLKPILLKAEMDYWNGKNQGIDEADLVNFVNEFADNQKLPEIAKTTVSQVHYFRMRLVLGEPEFHGKGVTITKNEETGEPTTATTKMSPLQAFDLVARLIDRKIIDEEFQKTPADWEAYLKNKSKDRPALGAQTWRQVASEGMSLNGRLRSAFNSMTASEAVSLISHAISIAINSQ